MDTTDGFGPGADSPQEAVTELIDDLEHARFGEAADLSVPGHAALASLAEGASYADVAAALRLEDTAVAANFWAGFAQGSASFLKDDVTVTEGGVVTEDTMELPAIEVVGEGEAKRTVYAQEVDGWRVDVFASFGAGLAGRMLDPVERLLGVESDDADLIRESLTGIVPSLHVAAQASDLPPELSQNVLRLIELISRVY